MSVEIEPLDKATAFYTGLGGISDTKLLTSLEGYHNPTYVIIDEVFYSTKPFANSASTIAISYKTVKAASSSYLIDVALYIQLWKAKSLVTCIGTGCMLSNIHSSSACSSLCHECKLKLPPQLSTSLLSLMSLKDMHMSVISQYINDKIGMFLRDKGLNTDDAGVKVASAEYIIDFVIDSNENLRKWLRQCGTYVKESKDKFKRKYSELRKPIPQVPSFIASRRWNSWTPNIPEGNRFSARNLGGGYLISDGFSKIIIDPGYGFISMLSLHGITIMDVDAIVITHDHPDHIADLQNILSLRYEFNTGPKLKLFLNGSSYYLYERLSSYYSGILDGGPFRVKAGDTFHVGSIEIKTCKMYHTEIFNHLPLNIQNKVRYSAPLGLSITGKFNDKTFNFAILGDSSFPQAVSEAGILADFFGVPDIMAVHLGSIETQWEFDIKARDIYYGDGKHLGLNGAIKSILLLQPKVAVITEFGEEHDRHGDRLSIIAIIKEACGTATTAIIPSDARLHLALSEYGILAKCSKCPGFVHTKNVEFTLSKDKSIIYSFPSGCESGLSHYNIG